MNLHEKLPTDGVEVKLKLRSVITVHGIPEIPEFPEEPVSEEFEEETDCLPDELSDEDGEPQNIEVVTVANFAEKDGRVTITYDDSEILDMPPTLSQITFTREEPEIVTVIRSGGISSMLVIEEGRHNAGEYKLGPYALPVSIYGRRVRNTMGDGEGEIELDYVVEMNGADTQRTKMKITVSR